MRKKIITSLAVIVLSPASALAATLPTPCLDSVGCNLTGLLFDNGQTSIWSATQALPGAPFATSTIWASYDLGSASQVYDPGYDSTGTPSITALTGTLWVQVSQMYYSGFTPLSVNVYTENYPGYYEERQFIFSRDALLSGHGQAYYSGGAGEVEPEDSVSYGSMSVNSFFTCIECGWGLELNLVNMFFIETAPGQYEFNINPFDSRQLVYQEDITYYYGTETTYTLAQAPVPAAAWLFGSALIGLAGIKRKK